MKRISIVFFIALCLTGSRAFATTWPASIFAGSSPRIMSEVSAHPNLVKQAESYLTPCVGMDSDTTLGCLFHQYNFVLDYIYSMYNEYSSEQNVADILAGQGGAVQQLGIVEDPIKACAWGIAVIAGGNAGMGNNSLQEYQVDCNSLSSSDQQAASDIAWNTILPEIQSHLQKNNPPFDVFTGAPAGKSPADQLN